MRTTITLDPDVHQLLKDTAHRLGKPVKRTLNDALRAGLQRPRTKGTAAAAWPCHDMGTPRVDLTKALSLADELDDQAR